jgi:hypothetical protein
VNADAFDTDWLLVGVVALVGFAFVDTPATAAEYVTAGVVLLVVFVGSYVPVQRNAAFRLVAFVGCLGIAAVSFAGAMGASNFVTAFGLDGMFASLVVVELIGRAYRRRTDASRA